MLQHRSGERMLVSRRRKVLELFSSTMCYLYSLSRPPFDAHASVMAAIGHANPAAT